MSSCHVDELICRQSMEVTSFGRRSSKNALANVSYTQRSDPQKYL